MAGQEIAIGGLGWCAQHRDSGEGESSEDCGELHDADCTFCVGTLSVEEAVELKA